MRVAVLGGSSVATVQLADALSDWPGGAERRPPLDVALHGRDGEKLDGVARRFAEAAGALAATTWSTRVDDVVAGADVVLVQVRIGGLAARRFDESYPWCAGLPGEETLGPGGFANALRTVRALEPTWACISRIAPEATVLILTNPAGLVRQSAALHGLSAIEVCDSPVTFLETLASELGRPFVEMARRYLGMNHVGWYVPTDDNELEALICSGVCDSIPSDAVRAIGALPLGYVRYYLTPDTIFEVQLGKPTRAEQLVEIEGAALEQLAAGKSPDSSRRPAPWYHLGVLPALDGLANGSPAPVVVGTANAGRVPGVSEDVTVEGLTLFMDRQAVEPLPAVELPLLALELLRRHAAYEVVALEAARSGEPKAVLAALLANPMVATARQAEQLAAALAEADPELSGLERR